MRQHYRLNVPSSNVNLNVFPKEKVHELKN